MITWFGVAVLGALATMYWVDDPMWAAITVAGVAVVATVDITYRRR